MATATDTKAPRVPPSPNLAERHQRFVTAMTDVDALLTAAVMGDGLTGRIANDDLVDDQNRALRLLDMALERLRDALKGRR